MAENSHRRTLKKDPESHLETRISQTLHTTPFNMLKTTNNLATTKLHTGNHSHNYYVIISMCKTASKSASVGCMNHWLTMS